MTAILIRPFICRSVVDIKKGSGLFVLGIWELGIKVSWSE
jgi:hypothetical protein